MQPSDLVTASIGALAAANAALRNIRLYPPSSPLIANSVTKAYESFQNLLGLTEEVEFSESEKTLLVAGRPLPEKEHKKPQVAAFLELLLDFGIKSIAFRQGLTPEELRRFLDFLSRPPEEIAGDSDAAADALAQLALSHIRVDRKVYVAMDEEHKALADLAFADTELVAYLLGKSAQDAGHAAEIKQRAQDPQWVKGFIKAGLAQIEARRQIETRSELVRSLVHMVEVLNQVVDRLELDPVAEQIAGGIAAEDPATADLYRSKAPGGAVGRKVSQSLEALPAKGRGLSAATAEEALTAAAREPASRNLSGEDEAASGSGIRYWLRDDDQAPGDGELLNTLPEVIAHLYARGDRVEADNLLERISRRLNASNVAQRAGAAEAMGEIGEKLLAAKLVEVMTRLAPRLIRWIERQEEPSPAFEKINHQMQALARSLLLDGRYSDPQPILAAYHRIHTGRTPRSDQVRAQATGTLDAVASGQVLDALLQVADTEDAAARRDALRIVALLLPVALDRLLDRLRDSPDMAERARVMNVLTAMGDLSPPRLIERLHKGGPWFYLRNLAKLLGKVGKTEHVDALVPLLGHEDSRVRQEALNTIYAIGGERREQVLLAALDGADERMRIGIVAMLGTLHSARAVPRLLAMLDEKSLLASKSRNELQEKICIALGRIGSPQAKPGLRAIAESKGLLRSYSADVKKAAAEALDRIQRAPAAEAGSGRRQPAEEKPEDPAERQVERHLRANDTEAAVQLLFDLIQKHARRKDFAKAEALHARLYEVDPMALSEIVRAAEIIEAEKKEGIDTGFLEIWKALYDELTTEEANALYYALEEVTVEADQPVFEQGASDAHLYFINGGRLKLTFRRQDHEKLLATLKSGDIAGQRTFFTPSVCTVSLIAVSRSRLHRLHQENLQAWRQSQPALEAKLKSFCGRFADVGRYLLEKRFERRRFRRVKLTGPVRAQLFDEAGKPLGSPWRGLLIDISAGGMAFMIRTAKSETPRLLLGRRLLLRFAPSGVEGPQGISAAGRVVAAHHHLFRDHALHVRFDEPLDGNLIAGLEAGNNRHLT